MNNIASSANGDDKHGMANGFPIHWILLASLFVIVAISFYKYYLTSNFLFLVEAPCDPATHECYQRDCSVDDECPPNNLDTYRIYSVSSSDFAMCTDNSCANLCEEDSAKCSEVLCSTQSDIQCVGE